MPPLNEGDVLYMPTTLPNLSIEEAKRQLEKQDAILATFPQVRTVFGKIGRAESPTDPAPLSMVETIVQLKPESQWATTHHDRGTDLGADLGEAPLSLSGGRHCPDLGRLIASMNQSPLQVPDCA
jgi:Cu/Ag efflux pump CusA